MGFPLPFLVLKLHFLLVLDSFVSSSMAAILFFGGESFRERIKEKRVREREVKKKRQNGCAAATEC